MASLRVRLSVGLRDAVATYLTLNVQIFPSSVTRLCIRGKKKKSVIPEENAERWQEVAFVAEKQMKRRRSPRFVFFQVSAHIEPDRWQAGCCWTSSELLSALTFKGMSHSYR